MFVPKYLEKYHVVFYCIAVKLTKRFIPFSEVNSLARIWPVHKHYCIVDIALCLLAITQ